MSAVRRVIMSNLLLERFEGALVGALVGDCLGAPFEFEFFKSDMKKLLKFFEKVDAGKMRGKCSYTDDTAMLRSVAVSLCTCRKFDAKDMSKRFTDEYFNDKKRGYGANIPAVFKQLRDTNYEYPFRPASKQFEGSGSHGNGGAMRIAPSALFGFNFSDADFNVLVEDITKVTHSHKNGILGATLEATAVQLALRSSAMADGTKLLAELKKRMSILEASDDKMAAEDRPFRGKLKKIEEFLLNSEPPVDDVAEELGNDVSALLSVPAAVYSFLRVLAEKSPEEWEKSFNPFQRTIIYAISLGGDTDTIASMAGAIAGAYYGISIIPKEWQDACEGLEDAKAQAKGLFELVHQKKSISCL